MNKSNTHPQAAIGIAALLTALCLVSFASPPPRAEEPTAIDAEQYADFMANEVLDIQDLAEGAEVQRRVFNRMTPPGFSWVQPMSPAVVPFDARNFDEKFLAELLGEDKNSVAIYPLSLTLDPDTRETLVFNADGKLIAAIRTDQVFREWPEDADPSRVTLQLDLLPSEDVEPYLYTESRIAEYEEARTAKTKKTGGMVLRSLGANEFGIAGIQCLTNGSMRITVTNGASAAEVFAYTVWHTSSVSVVVWTNEYDEVLTNSHTAWHPVSPPFDGIENAWECLTTNLVLTNGVGIFEDANIPTSARVRFYAVANRLDSDGDGLTDGAEIFIHRTDPGNPDTDGDGWSDAEELAEETDPLDRFSAPKLARGVVLNEVLYDASGTDWGKEWIELYSAGRYPVDLGGFVIQVADTAYTNAYVFPPNTWIDPGRFLLLGGSLVTNRDLEVDFTMPNRFTNDATAAVRLAAEVGTNTFVADCLMYGGNAANFNPHGLDTTGWISSNALSAGAGRSLYRRFNGHDTDQVMDWQYTSSPTSNSSADIPDSDGDGLTDQEELTGSLNPYGEPTDRHNADSDGDGLSDYAECITHGTNPNTWATDGDIFPWPPPSGAVSDWWGSDPYEIANGWNPLVLDENANGIPDSWEMAFPGTNLYADADGDGISNYDELAQNSDPNDINSTMAQPYVIRYESSLPGWVNDGMTDIGLEGWVKTYFEGLKADMDLCVWVKEGRTQEEFRVVWRGATEKGVHWLSDQEVVTSASAGADTRPYLFVQDLGMHPDYTNTLGGEYKMAVLSVDITFADPDDSGWADLEERKVILSDKDTRIKIKITPQLNDLQTIFDALGTTLKIKTSETAPSGQDFTLTAQNTTLTQGSGYSELRVALTRAQLISLGVLPSQESDSVTEKAWIDHGSSSSSDPSNLTDGEAFESGSSAETRGRSTNYGDLESTPPNSPVDETFFIAAGREVLTAEYSCGISHKRQLMNQADYFYYSGHGGHDTAVLQGGFSASDVTGYWDKDMHYVVLAGCSVLDIKDYRAQSFGLGTWLQWYAARGAWSPGAQWEPTGPKYFLGYNWSAPLDNQGSAGIISNFLSALGGGASIVDAWKQANDLGVGRNACVIDANSSPHVYWYWDETSGTPVWTNVTKSGGSW